MREIPRSQVLARIRAENAWWQEPHAIGPSFADLRPRPYLDLFQPLLTKARVRRAILLMGPRRVGKTVLLHHSVQRLITENIPPRNICYIAVDHPIYNGCGLDDLLDHFGEASGTNYKSERCYVFFDEIQYLKRWEVHLKSLVDTYPNLRFTASGSAAAALRLKSNESGAGRFTDFMLPPLAFHEYLTLLGKTEQLVPDLFTKPARNRWFPNVRDVAELNKSFVHYLNFGGYPEVIFSPEIQADPQRFIKSDIIDKVLLRDLPSLYGIEDIQELNHLFTTLAFNTAGEVSLEQLAQSSGVAKNTIKKYIEYLEAAFLIKVVHRMDRNGKKFQRATFFKTYLTNPSIRSALFSVVKEDDEMMGHLAETGLFAQWFHLQYPLFYARWEKGEVDIVGLGERQKPAWAVEVKWSDRFVDRPTDLKGLIGFCKANGVKDALVTTKTLSAVHRVDGISVEFVPASVYCHNIGFNIIKGLYAKARIPTPTHGGINERSTSSAPTVPATTGSP